MAEVDVKKSSTQSSTNPETSKGDERGLQRQGGGTEVSRSRGWDPFGFSLTPADLFSANPFSLMRRMSEEMDRTFGSFFGQAGRSSGTWFPAIEVAENKGQLQVHAELPGLKPEDVKVEVTNDSLILRGERKSEHEHRSGGIYRSERRYGEFYREIPLPEGIKPDEAKGTIPKRRTRSNSADPGTGIQSAPDPNSKRRVIDRGCGWRTEKVSKPHLLSALGLT